MSFFLLALPSLLAAEVFLSSGTAYYCAYLLSSEKDRGFVTSSHSLEKFFYLSMR
jgi:hypothetical protein